MAVAPSLPDACQPTRSPGRRQPLRGRRLQVTTVAGASHANRVPRPLSTRRARGCCSGRQRAVDRCVETDAGRALVIRRPRPRRHRPGFRSGGRWRSTPHPSVAQTRGADRAGRSTILWPRSIPWGASRPGRSAQACRARRCARRTLLCSPYVRSQSILASPGARRPCQRPVASTLFASGPRAPLLPPEWRPHRQPTHRLQRRGDPRRARRSTRRQFRGL